MADQEWDVAVIGGGSGGLACVKACAELGVKCVVFDFVKPSPQGSKWGLGGTCVNVGCVPKKLMHNASRMGQVFRWDGMQVGWQKPEKIDDFGDPQELQGECDWPVLVQNVQNYVRQLNFSSRGSLRSAAVTYINSHASFAGENTIAYTLKGEMLKLKAKMIIIAVGGRPHIPEDVPGARELAISSDDIFSLKTNPKNTLVIGASYIALECAGFLRELGYSVTVAVRSILLRGFDRQCAEKVGSNLKEIGVNFLMGCVPKRVEKCGNGAKKVTLQYADGRVDEMIVDTLLYATGRYADVHGLNLDSVGVKLSENGKIICTLDSQTSAKNIYALGDAVENFPELTPAAIKAGEILARRNFAKSNEIFDKNIIPTAVFTPIEFASVGLSEEDAIAKFGDQNVEIFLREFSTLEISALHRNKALAARISPCDTQISPPCLSKLICVKSDNLRVCGVHIISPSASEIIQGFAVAIRLNACKKDFDDCVGVHPTDAESLVQLYITKRSGVNWVAAGGCGGGKCG